MSNEDIKMSDVFDLPVQSGADGCVYDLHYSRICTSGSNSKEITHAINNHDPMALRIKELEVALNKISELTNNHNVINAKQIADNALGNGKKQ